MDRKEKIRQYKETPRPAGVYQVLHRTTGRMLLGASVDAPAMLNRIRAQLDFGSFPEKQLQADWDVEGETGFEFDVVDLLPPPEDPSRDIHADLDTLLALWKDKVKEEGGLLY
jgi:hypothetical protein